MVRLRPGQLRVVIANVPALGNVAAGSLLFGQFLSDRTYSPTLAVIGLTTWVVLFGIAFFFAAKE